MRIEDLRGYLDSKIKINLKNGFIYSGHIKELQEDSILFIDKFGNKLTIDIEEISMVAELGGDSNGY